MLLELPLCEPFTAGLPLPRLLFGFDGLAGLAEGEVVEEGTVPCEGTVVAG